MNAVLRGALAGAIGTATLELLDPIERATLGQTPPFAPCRIAAALVDRVAPRASRRRVGQLARVMRWTYGPGLGVAYGVVASPARRSIARRSLRFGSAIFGFELIALPLVAGGERFYRARTLAALAVHVAAFAIVVAGADRLLTRARRASPTVIH